jgi:hypothetical protein
MALVNKTNHLINKEEMVHVLHWAPHYIDANML